MTRLAPGPLPFLFSSGFVERQRLVIRDAEAWRQAWDRMFARSLPQPAMPEIDFATEMVILTALGERPTGGYSIFIEAASASRGHLTVHVRAVSPGPACARTLALTQPVDVARVSRMEGAVRFEEETQERNCG